MSGNSTYYPVVGVAGYPIIGLPNYDKLPVVMLSPNPNEQLEIEHDVIPETPPRIITIENGLVKIAMPGGITDWRDRRSMYLGDMTIYVTHVPDKKLKATFTFQQSSGADFDSCDILLSSSRGGMIAQPQINVADQPNMELELPLRYYRYPIDITLSAITGRFSNYFAAGDFLQLQFSLVDA